jgi:EmrB/QacA subfamily drug resistance transporter
MDGKAWVLVAAIAGSSMSFIDGSAVNVALPVLQADLHASGPDVQWVVEAYSLVLSALILVGGSLGDAFGRKRVFGIGIAIFACASLGCAFAPEIHLLIVARCVQGAGGALATPGSLALIAAAFEGSARGRAIGTWSGAASMTAALGPVIGGVLVQQVSWRAVFLINIPIAAGVFVALARVKESRDPAARGAIDVRGAALATLGLGAFVYGLIRLQAQAADGVGLAVTAAGMVVLALFVVAEARSNAPMMPLRMFASRAFAVANAYTFLLYAALGGSLFFVPFVLIDVQGYTPTAAGAAQLPFIAMVAIFSRWSGGLIAHVGARVPLAVGGIVAALAFMLFARPGIGASYWASYFPASLVLGAAGVCFIAPLTTLVMDSVAREHSGARHRARARCRPARRSGRAPHGLSCRFSRRDVVVGGALAERRRLGAGLGAAGAARMMPGIRHTHERS